MFLHSQKKVLLNIHQNNNNRDDYGEQGLVEMENEVESSFCFCYAPLYCLVLFFKKCVL